MATLTQKSESWFNKWVILALIGLVVYFTGGFKFITSNPALIIFAILALIVINAFNGSKK